MHANKFAVSLGLSLLLLFPAMAGAGFWEVLSSGANYLSPTGRSCKDYDEAKAKDGAAAAAACGVHTESVRDRKNLFAVSDFFRGTAEDQFFSLLAAQHSSELCCAATFAQKISQTPAKDLEGLLERAKWMRAARQKVLALTQEMSSNVNLPKVCDNTQGETSRFPICDELFKYRTAYQALRRSFPLTESAPVMEFLDKYSLSAEKDEANTSDEALAAQLKAAYRDSVPALQKQSEKLSQTATMKGGHGFDRSTRRVLFSDPKVVNQVLKMSGNNPDLRELSCSIDTRYGQGAELLDLGLTTGATVAAVATYGATSSIALGAGTARSLGLMSMGAMRALQVSSLALTSLASYSQLDKACFSTAPKTLAQGTDANNSCVSAPTISDVPKDNCIVTGLLTALGVKLALPSKSALNALKVRNSSITRLSFDNVVLEGKVKEMELAPGYRVLSMTDKKGRVHLIDPDLTKVTETELGVLPRSRPLATTKEAKVIVDHNKAKSAICAHVSAFGRSTELEKARRVLMDNSPQARNLKALATSYVQRCLAGLGVFAGTTVAYSAKQRFPSFIKHHMSNSVWGVGIMAATHQCLTIGPNSSAKMLAGTVATNQAANVYFELDISGGKQWDPGYGGKYIKTDLADFTAGTLAGVTYYMAAYALNVDLGKLCK